MIDATYDAGFETSNNFYEQAPAMLGMNPIQYRKGTKGDEIRYTIQACWLGLVLVAATLKGVCAIAFDDTKEALTAQLQKDFPNAQLSQSDPDFQGWVEEVLRLVETPQHPVHLPLDVHGTAFQQQIWQILQTIPPGTTLSYGDVATRMGNPKAVRAVARACASNHLAVVIPCHRVVGGDGSLRGYRWGRDRKQALLNKEAVTRDRLANDRT